MVFKSQTHRDGGFSTETIRIFVLARGSTLSISMAFHVENNAKVFSHLLDFQEKIPHIDVRRNQANTDKRLDVQVRSENFCSFSFITIYFYAACLNRQGSNFQNVLPCCHNISPSTQPCSSRDFRNQTMCGLEKPHPTMDDVRFVDEHPSLQPGRMPQ